jgi:ATP-dependent RNA helicase RhlE
LKFSEFDFDDSLLEGLDMMGFKEATPIQEQAIPIILQGRDILGVAQTGTGKTAAFLLPIIQMLTKSEHKGIHTLILGPTRELVMQVDQQLEALSYFTGTSSIPIYGGRGGQEMEQEKRALKRGADIVVATPGRLISHLEMGYAQIDNLQCLILDEADRMLDMGFAPAIQTIVNKLPQKRQTLLFSATMPNDIRRFSKQMLNDPAEINIAISKPAENIMQGAYEVEDAGKIPLTADLLADKKNLKRIIIFASTKKKVRDLTVGLQRAGLDATDISSDLEQSDRENRLQSFKNGTIPIVVATDVLSRGIDVSGIDLVINYDVPGDGEDYVHRIGRTARAEASGVALTYVNGEDMRKFKRIEEMIETKIRRIPLPPDLEGYKAKPYRGGGGRGHGGRSGGGGGRGRSGGNKRRSGGKRR